MARSLEEWRMAAHGFGRLTSRQVEPGRLSHLEAEVQLGRPTTSPSSPSSPIVRIATDKHSVSASSPRPARDKGRVTGATPDPELNVHSESR